MIRLKITIKCVQNLVVFQTKISGRSKVKLNFNLEKKRIQNDISMIYVWVLKKSKNILFFFFFDKSFYVVGASTY